MKLGEDDGSYLNWYVTVLITALTQVLLWRDKKIAKKQIEEQLQESQTSGSLQQAHIAVTDEKYIQSH